MDKVRWARWVARLDMEPLLSNVLLVGVLGSAGLVLAALALLWMTGPGLDLGLGFRGTNVFHFLWADLSRLDFLKNPSRLLADLGLAILMVIPCVRVFLCMIYFALVERDFTYFLFTGVVSLALGYILLFG